MVYKTFTKVSELFQTVENNKDCNDMEQAVVISKDELIPNGFNCSVAYFANYEDAREWLTMKVTSLRKLNIACSAYINWDYIPMA